MLCIVYFVGPMKDCCGHDNRSRTGGEEGDNKRERVSGGRKE